MAVALTIRNLTSETVFLVHIEQFQDPSSLQSKSAGHFFKSKGNNITIPTSSELFKHAQRFQSENLSIKLDPFEAYTYEAKLNQDDKDTSPALFTTKLRLTIQTGIEDRFRIDVNPSYTQKSSHVFTPLVSNKATIPGALFHPANPIAHLTMHAFEALDYKSWMKTLPDSLPVSAISIPGTHNSHTHYRALPSVRCQSVDVKTQLEYGIRFLDIRLQPVHGTDTSKKDLYLVHGAFPISLAGRNFFTPVIQLCYDFLNAHPSETILISLKREGIGNATDDDLASILHQHYISSNASKWYINSSIPCLGAVRGKLVLIRRFDLSSSFTSPSLSSAGQNSIQSLGLDATAWPHNTTHALFPLSSSPSSLPSHPTFCLQDYCDVLHPTLIPTKLQHATTHLVRAAAYSHPVVSIVDHDQRIPHPHPHPLHLNFLSASNFWKKSVWPGQIARVLNAGVETWICAAHALEQPKPEVDQHQHQQEQVGQEVVQKSQQGRSGLNVRRRAAQGDAGTGIVVMDFVGENGDWDLVRLVIGMNIGVLMKIAQRDRGTA